MVLQGGYALPICVQFKTKTVTVLILFSFLSLYHLILIVK
jgi:hypothetical protein